MSNPTRCGLRCLLGGAYSLFWKVGPRSAAELREATTHYDRAPGGVLCPAPLGRAHVHVAMTCYVCKCVQSIGRDHRHRPCGQERHLPDRRHRLPHHGHSPRRASPQHRRLAAARPVGVASSALRLRWYHDVRQLHDDELRLLSGPAGRVIVNHRNPGRHTTPGRGCPLHGDVLGLHVHDRPRRRHLQIATHLLVWGQVCEMCLFRLGIVGTCCVVKFGRPSKVS